MKVFSVHHFSEQDSPIGKRDELQPQMETVQIQSDNESASSKTTDGCEMNLRDMMAQFQSNPNPVRMR